MAVKKSDLYASIWASCDALRGGMDASQYKDYVLFMLFVKYISDKYADSDDFAPPVTIPPGASFRDMVAMKGHKDIGERINVEVIQPLIDANPKLSRNDFPDFNDAAKLGDGKEMVERLTELVAIFEKPELHFGSNRADNDDLLGDAYEYLMRHFAAESGKAKGQFYTPSEVSRVIAQVIGISPDNARASTTAYDPTCGSGSLLLKVAHEAGKQITLEGQEKDVTTAGLARMNMILHDFPTATIVSGNTLASPKFLDGQNLRTYDYVVANPPFSDKKWITGLSPATDPYQRFAWGEPPGKQGDYAYLLHIIRSMKSDGKAACILPHGVLFRGNAEGVLRKRLVKSGYLKAIIGLPANLFYGTGIPACILVLDKVDAQARKGIFMIDASKGFAKDGPKNKLRDQDVHRIVDTFSRQRAVPRYARMVPTEEIASEKNDYNLNLPRYIDTSEPEDVQDINAHLRGGIPERDVAALERYWAVLPSLRATLFGPSRFDGYLELASAEVKAAILEHEEFVAFRQNTQATFDAWCREQVPLLESFGVSSKPKELIASLSESLLEAFAKTPLLDAYDIYQHLMDYWAATMEDDAYLIAADGWVASAKPVAITDKKSRETVDFQVGKTKYRADFLPSRLLIARAFAREQSELDALESELASLSQQMEELAEEHGGEEGSLSEATGDNGKITKATATARLKAARREGDADPEELRLLNEYLEYAAKEALAKKEQSNRALRLSKAVLAHYEKLTEAEVKRPVIDDKWLATLRASLRAELNRVSQNLAGRIRELSERYAEPLPELEAEVERLNARVADHLKTMGALWN